MTDTNIAGNNVRLLTDPYLEWASEQGVPVVEDFGVDLLDVQTKPWDRLGADTAFVHLKGRGDFIAINVVDLAPGASTEPQQHLFEEVVYVLSGHGTTTVESPDGKVRHSFEWGPKALFALPLNMRYRHFNVDGTQPARLACTHNLPMIMKTFRKEEFIFDNPADFTERVGGDGYFSGQGTFIPVRPGKHMWETNYVPDLSSFELRSWEARGKGSTNMMFVLADGTMHAHMSEIPTSSYKKAHRHGADFHVYTVTGEGYSLLWYEGESDFHRVDWRHGVVFAPPDRMFHQHFNLSPAPARYLAVAFGGLRYPFSEDKIRTFKGVDVSVRDGGAQIEYEDQDPRIDDVYRQELARAGQA